MAGEAQLVPDFVTGLAQFVPDFGASGPPPTGVKKIYLGATQVQTLNLGTTPIVSVYVGSVKVFGP